MCVKIVRLNRWHRPFPVVVGLDPTTATSAGGGDSARKTKGLCGGDARVKPEHDEIEMAVAPYFNAYGITTGDWVIGKSAGAFACFDTPLTPCGRPFRFRPNPRSA